MKNSCNKFLESQLAKGGQKAYVALLMLAAVEINQKELLKRIDFSFVQSNLKESLNHTVTQNQAS
ncbi:hypothetical protein WMO40_21005 [Bacillaceae bacterium CLA-AA-H227]|uniref:Uncharacterized protein n=1 Tax=Robertmurraya yapensis (ex Hitch et al 2024) TaxID=3133160 RepID=A0ACC6SGC1_9BACI